MVDLGASDDGMALRLGPGETLELPEILVQPVPGGDPVRAAPLLHSYANSRWFARGKPFAPVIYNTWFDRYDSIEPARLEAQLAAARAAGCEVFVIDAGWFGEAGDWFARVGDWRPRRDGPFAGRLEWFRDRVKAAGLGFGLWMEPERVSMKTPLAREHPEWLIYSCRNSSRLDLTNPEARGWLARTISGLVEEHGLAWMKVDFNFGLGPDPAGGALSGHFAAWHGLLDEIRARHPGTFFEGCAGGGGRADLGMMTRFDAHFLSDNVTPTDVLRIFSGALLRVPPGRISMWPVLRNIPGKGLCAARLHSFDDPIPVDPDFACLVCMPGMFGLSGDLASLSPEQLSRVRFHVDYCKANRESIVRSSARLLTPPLPVPDETGWVALQLDDPVSGIHRLFAHRLNDPAPRKSFRLEGLEPDVSYTLADEEGKVWGRKKGSVLAGRGVEVSLGSPMSSFLTVVAPGRRGGI